jgi:uncharacterized short protein YbdD (DUF466 family)
VTTNTAIWDALGKTDPAQTKGFNRAGGFKGTSVKPIWIQRRLTEQFGPAGIGWGVNEPRFDLVHSQEGEVLVFCTVSAWHGKRENVLWGVGGDKAVTKRNDGKTFHDDEAFKKAFTDAVGNAFKSLGVAADIHMGLFDDDKYVATMEREFADKPATLSEDQRTEIMALLDATGVPAADFLAVGPWKDLRDVPAAQFELGKKWINKKAREREAQKEDA